MSLQLWLPLNGDLSNNGLMDIEMTCATPSWSDAGKIGKCASFSGVATNVIYNNSTALNYTDNFSFALWVYHSGVNNQFAFTVGRADMGGYGYGISSVSSTQIRVYFGGHHILVNCSANAWHHITATIGNGQFKIYVDGVLANTTTITTRPTYSDGKGLGIGCFRYNVEDIYFFNGKINDFRIYDHCLSPKEVKEISKGLMLHYPLSSPYDISFANKYSGATAKGKANESALTLSKLEDERGYNYKMKYTGTGENHWKHMYFPNFEFTPNKTYQYSCKIRLHKYSTNINFEMRGARYNNDWGRPSAALFNNILIDEQWHTLSIAVTIPTTFDLSGTTTTASPLVEFWSGNLSTNGTVYEMDFDLKDVQVVECDGPVEFIENEFLDNTIYDTSGYKNNGAISEASKPILGADSPRNQNSYHFKDLQNLNLPVIAYENMSKGTISFWIKFNEKFLNWSHYLQIANGFNWTGQDADFIIVANRTHLTSAVTSTSINIDTCSYSAPFTASLNTWYHIVIEWDADNYLIKHYVNGSLLSTFDDSSYKRLDTYRDNHYLNFIGNGYLETAYNGDFNISDFRIYATCLSDSDIQELYNKPISIDNQGVMFAVEAVEESASPVKFNKTGVVEANQIGEYLHNYFDYDGPMYTGINNKVKVEKLIENNGLKLTCNFAVTTTTILHRMQSLMFNGASGEFKVEFDAWATNPISINADICDRYAIYANLTTSKQHFSGIASNVNQYNTSSAYNGFFDLEVSSIPLGTEIYITNIVITKNTPKSIGSNYIVMDDIIEC